MWCEWYMVTWYDKKRYERIDTAQFVTEMDSLCCKGMQMSYTDDVW